MELHEVETMIRDLENSDNSFSTARNLASLYIVRSQLQEKLNITLKQSGDAVLIELYDVIPSYKKYVEIKRKYQLNEVSDTKVLEELKILCKEIKEFIHTLYISTYNNEERQLLKQLVDDLKKML